MPSKKKAPAAKPVSPAVRRMAMQEMLNPKTHKDGTNLQASSEADRSHAGGASAQPARAPDQLEVFDAAIKLFHARKYKEARERFLVSMRGGDRGIAHKSGLHVRMCDQRLEEQSVVLH